MKINMNQVKERIAGFIFDLIIESGSKSKFFRKYTNHRFRKQYERWGGIPLIRYTNATTIWKKRIASCIRELAL